MRQVVPFLKQLHLQKTYGGDYVDLSSDLLSQFIKATNDTPESSKATKLYGTVKINNSKAYVQLDGSDIPSPTNLAVGADDGNRVIVEIRDHELYVTGNISSPSKTADESDKTYANFTTIDAITARIGSLEATQITAAYLQATYASITTLDAATARIADLEATSVKMETLQANYATIQSLDAAKGRIASLESNQITTDYLNAHYANLDIIQATYAKITDLTAATARIGILESNQITTEYLQSNYVSAAELNATKARIDVLESNQITTDYLNANYAKISDLSAATARIGVLESNQINVAYMDAHYANLGLTNIDDGCIKTAMIDVGAVKTAQIADASITTAKIIELDAARIKTGTLSVERLELVGSTSSVVYALNNVGGLVSTTVDTLDGDVLTPKSITADKIVANSITSNEIAAHTLTANQIAANAITASEIAAGAITTVKIAAGAITAEKIYSHSITAEQIDVTNLFAQDITASGTIRGVNIVGSKITQHNDNFQFGFDGNYYTGVDESTIDASGITHSFIFDTATANKYGFNGVQTTITPFELSVWRKSGTSFSNIFQVDGRTDQIIMSALDVQANKMYVGEFSTPVVKIVDASTRAFVANAGGMLFDNNYYGLCTPYGDVTDWIRTSEKGLLPYNLAFAGTGTSNIGDTQYYFGKAYIDTINCSTDIFANRIAASGMQTNNITTTTLTATTINSGVMIKDATYNTSRIPGVKSDGSYWGLTDPLGNDGSWIRTSQPGIIPYASGGPNASHSSLGTDTWWFYAGYMTNLSAVNSYITNMRATTINTTNLNVSGYSNASYHFCTADLICGSWIRTVGATGWYNETYGGGWWMQDTTYIRNFNNKQLLMDNHIIMNNANIGFYKTYGLSSCETGAWMIRFKDQTAYANVVTVGDSNYITSIHTNGNVWKNSSSTTYFATTSTSDKRLKEYAYDMESLEGVFMELIPRAFRYHDGLYNAPGKKPLVQWGYYAQDVIAAFTKYGIDWREQELVVLEDGELTSQEQLYVNNDLLKMNYQNLFSLHTQVLQKSVLRLNDHDKRLNNLERDNHRLEMLAYNLQFELTKVQLELQQYKQAVA